MLLKPPSSGVMFPSAGCTQCAYTISNHGAVNTEGDSPLIASTHKAKPERRHWSHHGHMCTMGFVSMTDSERRSTEIENPISGLGSEIRYSTSRPYCMRVTFVPQASLAPRQHVHVSGRASSIHNFQSYSKCGFSILQLDPNTQVPYFLTYFWRGINSRASLMF